jgi:hypothetical protein
LVQYNDPDWYIWIPAYLSVAVIFLLPQKINSLYPKILGIAFFIWMCAYIPDFIKWINNGLPSITGSMKAENPEIEFMREFFGIIICLISISFFLKNNSSKILIAFTLCLVIFNSCNKKISMPLNLIQENELPYKTLPTYNKEYSAELTVARMIDGLGFRFYWATEKLTETDLSFKPNTNARTSEETIDHIMGLAIIIKNAVNNKPNLRSGEETSPLDFKQKRELTLKYLNEASNILKSGDVKANDINIIFISKDQKKTEYPLWNLINGPISDALWHVGQIVSFRRSSGNPFDSKVSVFTGTVRE